MKQTLFQEKYPLYKMEIEKDETSLKGVDAIIEYLKKKVEEHPAACFIAVFDHYGHTKGLPGGEINSQLLDAKNIIFCFGIKLPNPEVLGVRPRAIGVAETRDAYVISFLEAPMAAANEAMVEWVKAIVTV